MHLLSRRASLVLLCCIGLHRATPAAQFGTVASERKITASAGGFGFGSSVASLGDLDGDGTDDVAVGAPVDDDGGTNTGAVWILFMNPDGTVASEQEISATEGGFGGTIGGPIGAQFGSAVAGLGDLDGDEIPDLAVGAPWAHLGSGAIFVLLNTDGTVRAEQEISETAGGFGGMLAGDLFGASVTSLGDLDGDGVGDLAVGAPLSDVAMETDAGAVWILFMEADGTVASEQKIATGTGGFGGFVMAGSGFGGSVEGVGDLDRDGIKDLAVAAAGAHGLQGAVWILFMSANGMTAFQQEISDGEGGFGGELQQFSSFGSSLAALDDLDGDGNGELVVGANTDVPSLGALWILFLEQDGTVSSERYIAEGTGGFGGSVDSNDGFAESAAALGDLDGDGVGELAVGVNGDDTGGEDQGAVWISSSRASGRA